jgi:hypothetical protein
LHAGTRWLLDIEENGSEKNKWLWLKRKRPEAALKEANIAIAVGGKYPPVKKEKAITSTFQSVSCCEGR